MRIRIRGNMSETQYTELGSFLLVTAYQAKNVRGPYNVAGYMHEEAQRRSYDLGRDTQERPLQLPKGGAVSKYFRGASYPEPWWIKAFADLFDLDEEQRRELAQCYAYRFK